jgi:hypothetical protein
MRPREMGAIRTALFIICANLRMTFFLLLDRVRRLTRINTDSKDRMTDIVGFRRRTRFCKSLIPAMIGLATYTGAPTVRHRFAFISNRGRVPGATASTGILNPS